MVLEQVSRQRHCLMHEILPSLREYRIVIEDYKNLDARQKKQVDQYFKESVFPILTPLGTGPGQPFPFISNLSLSLGVHLRNPKLRSTSFARIKIPRNRPRWIPAGEAGIYVPLEQVIEANLDQMFPGLEILDNACFRVTRNADIERNEEEAEDLLELVEEELRFRKYAAVVRLEIEEGASPLIEEWLMDELELSDEDVYRVEGYLNLKDIMQLLKSDIQEIKDPPWQPVTPPLFRKLDHEDNQKTIFDLLQEKEVLLHIRESFANTQSFK